MQTEDSPYPNGRAVQAAIKSAAQRDVRARSVGVGDLIRQATFDRFLCRVFSVQPPKFVLKGGTGMLARLSTSRATKDIDLSAGEGDLETAVADLSQVADKLCATHARYGESKFPSSRVKDLIARPLGRLKDFPNASVAEERVKAMLNPILDGTVTDGRWEPDAGIWMKSK